MDCEKLINEERKFLHDILNKIAIAQLLGKRMQKLVDKGGEKEKLEEYVGKINISIAEVIELTVQRQDSVHSAQKN